MCDLSLGIAEVIVARPALIAEYQSEITDCWAFLWRFKVLEPIDKLVIQAAWLDGFQWKSGGATSGQWLDAQTWDDEQTEVSLGTEGGDALFARAEKNNWLPARFTQQSRDDYHLSLLSYETNGMIVDFGKVCPNELFQTHFVVAWSQYVDESISTWNAVDLNAQQIVAGAAGKTVWPQI